MGKIDPRVIKTRRKLKQAFLELLKSHNLNDMNVKDLTQTADVTRGTFYLHYKDKETFIEVMMNELIDEFYQAVMFEVPVNEEDKETAMPVISLLQIFEYVGERPDFFTVLLKEKHAVEFRERMSDRMFEFVEAHLKSLGIKMNGKVPKELLMNYLMYALLGYIDGWINDGMIYANHFMATNLQKLLNSQLIEEVGLERFFVTDVTSL